MERRKTRRFCSVEIHLWFTVYTYVTPNNRHAYSSAVVLEFKVSVRDVIWLSLSGIQSGIQQGCPVIIQAPRPTCRTQNFSSVLRTASKSSEFRRRLGRTLLAPLPAQHAEQGPCKGTVSVRPSVCPSIGHQQGLLLWAGRAGDIDRLLHGRRSAAALCGGRMRAVPRCQRT